MRLDGKRIDHLAIQREGPSRYIAAKRRQQPVVMPCPSTDPKPSGVKHKAGDENPVNLVRFDLGAAVVRLGNPEHPPLEVGVEILDPVEPEPPLDPVHARTDQALAPLQCELEHRLARDLLREGRDVEQDRPCGVEAREVSESSGEGRLLSLPIRRVESKDPLDHCLAELPLLGPEVHDSRS